MDYYFTFGLSHKHPLTKEPMKDYYVRVKAKNYGRARNAFVKKYGIKWAFQYTRGEFNFSHFNKGEYKFIDASGE